MNIEDIKFREVELFLSLIKIKSVRELGRQENMQPGQVSKWISSLERKVGHPLIERSSTGVRPTAKAMELLPVFQKIHLLQEKLSETNVRKESEIFSFASSSFFSSHLVPLVIQKLDSKSKFKLIDLAPTNFISAALRGAFNFCLHSQELEWPKTWTTIKVGNLKWNLYARKKHPVLKAPTIKKILEYPFITPIYWTPEGTHYGDDQCPIPMSKRIKGHETATAASAAEIAAVTDQLAFLPEVVAQKAKYPLEVVKVSWKQIEKPVYLSVKNSVVKASDFERISEAAREVLLPL